MRSPRFPEYRSDQRIFFDQLITDHWDTYRSDDWDFSRRFEIEKLFGIVKPRSVLDIGCGCGFQDTEMANYDFVERVHAIDYSTKSIAKAEQTYPHPKVSRWVADFVELPTVYKYDLVASFQVFEHLSNPHAYLETCKGLLSEGGAMAICTPNWGRLDNRIRQWQGLEPTFVDPQHYREYTPALLRKLAVRHGYRPIGWFGCDITTLLLPSLNKLRYSQRLRVGYWLPHISRVFCMVFRYGAT
jgi:SAM-dependent methyltransferase